MSPMAFLSVTVIFDFGSATDAKSPSEAITRQRLACTALLTRLAVRAVKLLSTNLGLETVECFGT